MVQAVAARQRTKRTRRFWIGAAFLAPAVVLYGVIFAYPVLTALTYGFYEWNGLNRLGFAGFDNFRSVFNTQPYGSELTHAAEHNAIFFVGTMLVQNLLGLLLALALHRIRQGKRFFQTLYAAPYLISPLVVGYLWSLMLVPVYGPISVLFDSVGLHSMARPWLGDPSTALPVLILINAWQWVGCPLLIFGAALAGMREELVEAAQMDGAGYWRVVRSIVLPQLIPAASVVTVLTFIGCFNVFDLVYSLGGATGGPAGSTDVLATVFYRISFGGSPNSIGLSGAMSALLFAGILVFTLAITRFMRGLERRYS